MKFLLEYNEKQHCFNANYVENKGDGLLRSHQVIGSAGWLPISVIPDTLFENDDFGRQMDIVCNKKAPYAVARDSIILWLLNHEEEW